MVETDGSSVAESGAGGDSAVADGMAPATSDAAAPTPACSTLARDHRLHRVGRHAGAAPRDARARAPRQREHHHRLRAHRLVHRSSPNVYNGDAASRRTRNALHPLDRGEPVLDDGGSRERRARRTRTTATPPDLGISALFPSSCAGLGRLRRGRRQFIGPIQAYTFIVPTAEFATQTAISAEEAYYAFGDGANNPVDATTAAAEWNVPSAVLPAPGDQEHARRHRAQHRSHAAEMTLAAADGGTADGRNLEAASTDVLTAVDGVDEHAGHRHPRRRGLRRQPRQGRQRPRVRRRSAESRAYYPDSTTHVASTSRTSATATTRSGRPTVYIAPVDSARRARRTRP